MQLHTEEDGGKPNWVPAGSPSRQHRSWLDDSEAEWEHEQARKEAHERKYADTRASAGQQRGATARKVYSAYEEDDSVNMTETPVPPSTAKGVSLVRPLPVPAKGRWDGAQPVI